MKRSLGDPRAAVIEYTTSLGAAMKSSAPRANKIEQDRIDKMLQMGCAACAFLGVPNLVHTECHHLLDGNVRLGHWFTIPLCAGHHRGCWSEGQLTWIEAHQRVAISDGRKAFTKIYPTEWQLWDRVQFVMRLDNTQPISKIVRRRDVEMDSNRVAAPETGAASTVQLQSPDMGTSGPVRGAGQ